MGTLSAPAIVCPVAGIKQLRVRSTERSGDRLHRESTRRESIGIPPLKVNKELIFSDNNKANCLNNCFSSVFRNVRLDNIPKLESSYPDMLMFTVTVSGVFKLLSKLNPKKSTGPDEPSPLVLEETAV